MTNLRLQYQTIEFGKTDIHLCTLRDRQQFSDPAGVAEKCGICPTSWPIFGIIWPSSLVLARFINDYDTGTKRILEIGCGIGLPSLLLNQKNADITATDYHPEVELFLRRNTKLNNCNNIFFERTNWADIDDNLGLFDLIIGSDLLYEDQHVDLLANFINTHSKPVCEVILVDPGRGRKTKFCSLLAKLGYTNSYHDHPPKDQQIEGFNGYILKFDKQLHVLNEL